MHLYLPEEVVTFYREENATTKKKTLKKEITQGILYVPEEIVTCYCEENAPMPYQYKKKS
jgi:hypothetical protein